MNKPNHMWTYNGFPIDIDSAISPVADWCDERPRVDLGTAIVDYAYNFHEAQLYITYLEGRIYELEQTIEGQEEAKELVSKSDWAWAEREED